MSSFGDTQDRLQNLLLQSTDYKQFLAAAFETLRQSEKNFTYAGFCRKAGIASRSFPRDVAYGAKKLSVTSAKSFSTALGLKTDYKNLFQLQVELEIATLDRDRIEIKNRIEKLRERLMRPSLASVANAPRDIFKDHVWIDVYAASGSVTEGSSLDQIASRAQLSPADAALILSEMQKKQVIRYDESTKTFFPMSLQLTFADLKADDFFTSWYLKSCAHAKREAEKRFADENALFLNSVFSIRSEEMRQFKKELKDLLEKFAEQAENAKGDRLARMNIAFY